MLVNGSQPNTPIIVQGGSLGGTGLLGPITLNGGSIQGAVMQASPIQPGQRDLVAAGTPTNDHIQFSPGATAGTVEVAINAVSQGSFAPTGRLVAYGLAGNDDIQVAGGLSLSAWLFGGLGNDRLKGGAGHDVLLGGEGDDLLLGGAGRDLMIGGDDCDMLVGNASDDMLIGGLTDFDANEAALLAIMAEWTRLDQTYEQRIEHLENGGGLNSLDGGLTFSKLDDGTVHDDDAVDVMTGSAGQDWFLAQKDGANKDEITNASPLEEIVDL